MSNKFQGDVAAVDRTIAAAIQALDSFKDPDPRQAFRQIGYVMRALHRWAHERERERNAAVPMTAEGYRRFRGAQGGKAPF